MSDLTLDEVIALRAAFSAQDTNQDGRITLGELREALRREGEEPLEADLRGFLVSADANDDTVIDFEEFLAFHRRRMAGPPDQAREAFDAFDRDGDGLVSVDELLHVMDRLGETMSREEAEAGLRRGDSDGDGRLSFDEFVAFMLGPH